MPEERFELIPLNHISPHPQNPRKRFSGPKYDALMASIKEKGVLQPILVRPVKDTKTPYQIVAGECRYNGACLAAEANGGKKKGVIPAMVRNLDDDEALDVMMIENFHRDDLTPIEEASGFRTWVERHGEHGVAELSKRINVDERYIRRRIAILALPKPVLSAWDKGEILYGHCEQLARLKDEADILEQFKKARDHRTSVRDLEKRLQERSPLLEKAVFDVKAAGCETCDQNTRVQKALLGLGDKSAKGKERCLDLVCFKKRVNDHLQANWKRSGYYKQHHTSGFRFDEEYPAYGLGPAGRQRHSFRWTAVRKPPKNCHGCKDLVTILCLDGTAAEPVACIGKQDCFDKATRAAAAQKTQAEKKKAQKKDVPRVAWHGEHFRQEFWKEQIPVRLQDAALLEEKMQRVALMAMLHAEHDLHLWFEKNFVEEGNRKRRETWQTTLPDDRLWDDIALLDAGRVSEALKQAAIQIMLLSQFSARAKVATYLGVDLGKEWAVNKAYLDKKTVAEIHEWADEHGIWKYRESNTYLFEVLNKKRGKFTSCKKDELVQLILNCGLDLRGLLPKEMHVKKRGSVPAIVAEAGTPEDLTMKDLLDDAYSNGTDPCDECQGQNTANCPGACEKRGESL